jgi:hypothetical protein
MPIPQFDIEFRKDGSRHDESQVAALLGGLEEVTDLLLLAHGWNNDMAEARELYDAFLSTLQDVTDAALVPGLGARTLAVARVFWPSKRFAESDLIPGGGAASATGANDAALVGALDRLKEDPSLLGGHDVDTARAVPLDRARQLVPSLETSAAARREFVQLIRAVLNPDEHHSDDASTEFFTLDEEELFRQFTGPVGVPLTVGRGGATALVDGGAAGFAGDLLSGVTAGARRIANFATYYQMKTRAGTVGRSGVAPVLTRVRDRHPALRLHLVGHSFGARLVTAAASALPPGTRRVSVTLLQGAFSHNGLAAQFDGAHDGSFRTLLADRRASGPVLITHTKNDRAVGVAYPLVSRISHDVASALGDENDPYGGIGRNGAQHTPEAESGQMQALGHPYVFLPGKVYNLRADAFVRDHSDVTGAEAVYAFAAAMVADKN